LHGLVLNCGNNNDLKCFLFINILK
jgi:hypothetical protein